MATFTVTNANSGGAGSLAAAIQAAEGTAAADRIVFSAGLGPIVVTQTFNLTTTVTIDGDRDNDGVADVTITGDSDGDGTGERQLFRVEQTGRATFDGLVLRDGREVSFGGPAAGAIENYGAVLIRNAQFLGNTSRGADGAAGGPGQDGGDGQAAAGAIYNAGSLSIDGATFQNNQARSGDGAGGGQGIDGEFSGIGGRGGDGGDGGAVAGAVLNASGGTMTLIGADFVSNSGNGARGGTGGNGGAGVTNGGNGGDGGDLGSGASHFLNFGSASGAFTQSGGGAASFSGGQGGAGGSSVEPGGEGAAGARGGDAQSGFALTVGTEGANRREGLNGNDEIYGLGGADVLSGNAGSDRLRGGDGDDLLDGGVGDDGLRGGDGNDTLKASVGNDVYEGEGGGDTLDFSAITSGVTIDLSSRAAQVFFGGSVTLIDDSVEYIVGTTRGDRLTGSSDSNDLNGGGGADTLIGGAGFDTYFVDDARDVVHEGSGAGIDTIATRVSYTIAADVFVETLTTTSSGGTAAINLIGNEFVGRIFGNAGNNVLDSRGGGSLMTGSRGNDTYFVDVGGEFGDTVVEKAGGGNDTVAARVTYRLGDGAAVETVRTSSNAGTATIGLAGNEFDQTIIGNAGKNTIFGRGGDDTMTGLGGADAFVFDRPLGANNIDRITDFARNVDEIRLDRTIFTTLATGALAASAFKDLADGAADSNDRILYNSATGGLAYDRDGAGGAAAIKFATLDNRADLTAADFLIIA